MARCDGGGEPSHLSTSAGKPSQHARRSAGQCSNRRSCWEGFLHDRPGARPDALPLFTLLAIVSALGPGLLFTALNVKYRDFRYIIPFVVQFGLYVSPVFYSTSLIQERFGDTGRALVALNPIVGVIDGFRWAICGTTQMHWQSFGISMLLSLLMLGVGVWYFRHTERTFADVI